MLAIFLLLLEVELLKNVESLGLPEYIKSCSRNDPKLNECALQSFDLNKKLISADALVNLDVKCQYDLSGKILLVPIKSNGDASIKLKNTMLHIRMWYEHVEGDDGNIHWKIYKHDIKYDVERAIFRLENLLNDKNIGDQVNKLLNEMWQEIVADVGPSICNSLSAAVVKNLGVLLEQVSYDELMPE
ncbi:circadian clock-controlled protein daywake-like [Epargyreus clarus]|uniref:circadian clock-controlled protein daywake-like n=1 Tax=Epargyreus clarus TaxID=520877 RepID=UPI003C2E411F